MRVVLDGIVYENNAEGGIARYFTEVIKAILLMRRDVQLQVVVPPGVQLGNSLPWLTSGRLFTSIAVARSDIFHTSYYTQWSRLKCPSVVTVYDFIDASFPLLQPNGSHFVDYQLDAIKRSSAVIAISQSSLKLTVELAGVDPSRVFLAYPGVSAPFSLPLPDHKNAQDFRQKLTGGAPYFIHVGKRTNYKNFRTILRAFCKAAPAMDRHLLILGGGQPFFSADELDMVISAQLLDRVHYFPWVDDQTLRLAYAGSDAMVHASLMEGFGIPVIEALACGTGLILSDIPVYREIAQGFATFVDATDTDAWVQAMKREVPVDPSWRGLVLDRYKWESAAQTHVEAYASVME